MAKLSYDYLQNETTRFDDRPRVGFFGLKNDGDEALVRFLCDDVKDFEILTVHPIQVDGKYRKVNCIRDPHDTMDKCPLCEGGERVQQRLYMKLLQYTKDESGNITVEPKIWERAGSIAKTFKSLIDEYGPLSGSLFKIKRCGKAGSVDTSYNILYCNPQIYRNDIYENKSNLFDGYKVLGNAVWDKSESDLEYYLDFGKFPDKSNDSNKHEHDADVIKDKSESIVEPIKEVPQQVSTPVRQTVVPERESALPSRPARRYY